MAEPKIAKSDGFLVKSDAFSGKWKVGACQTGMGQSAQEPHEGAAETIISNDI